MAESKSGKEIMAAGGPDIYHVVVNGKVVSKIPMPLEIARIKARQIGGEIQLYKSQYSHPKG